MFQIKRFFNDCCIPSYLFALTVMTYAKRDIYAKTRYLTSTNWRNEETASVSRWAPVFLGYTFKKAKQSATFIRTLNYYGISRYWKELLIIFIVVTPSNGSVIYGQQILVVFMRRMSANRVKQVMLSFHWRHVEPQRKGYTVYWFVSERFPIKFNIGLSRV